MKTPVNRIKRLGNSVKTFFSTDTSEQRCQLLFLHFFHYRVTKHNKTGLQPVSMTCGTGSLFWRVGRGCKVPKIKNKRQNVECRIFGGKKSRILSNERFRKNFSRFEERNWRF